MQWARSTCTKSRNASARTGPRQKRERRRSISALPCVLVASTTPGPAVTVFLRSHVAVSVNFRNLNTHSELDIIESPPTVCNTRAQKYNRRTSSTWPGICRNDAAAVSLTRLADANNYFPMARRDLYRRTTPFVLRPGGRSGEKTNKTQRKFHVFLYDDINYIR